MSNTSIETACLSLAACKRCRWPYWRYRHKKHCKYYNASLEVAPSTSRKNSTNNRNASRRNVYVHSRKGTFSSSDRKL